MNTIEESWEKFSKVAIPANADERQVRDMRLAYFSGASRILDISSNLADKNVSQEAYCAVFDGLVEEILKELASYAAYMMIARLSTLMAAADAERATKN